MNSSQLSDIHKAYIYIFIYIKVKIKISSAKRKYGIIISTVQRSRSIPSGLKRRCNCAPYAILNTRYLV